MFGCYRIAFGTIVRTISLRLIYAKIQKALKALCFEGFCKLDVVTMKTKWYQDIFYTFTGFIEIICSRLIIKKQETKLYILYVILGHKKSRI